MAKHMEVGQFAEFSAAVLRSLPRNVDANIAQGWITNQDALAKVLHDALVPPPRRFKKNVSISFPGTFVVTVLYARTFENMVSDCKNDYVDPEVSEAMFPIFGEGEKTSLLQIITFDEFVYTSDVVARFQTLGLKAAKIEHLLALGESHPDFQRNGRIVALGSTYCCATNSYNYKIAPLLEGHKDVRLLCVERTDIGWSKGYHFLAVEETARTQ